MTAEARRAPAEGPVERAARRQKRPRRRGREGGSTATATVETVPLDDARRIIAAGEQEAGDQGQPMDIAVVDAGGDLVAHMRIDGAWRGSAAISIDGAFTSRASDISTKDLGGESQPGGQLSGIHASNGGRIVIFAGGIPLTEDGMVVGAVWVGGGLGAHDQAVAEAASAAF